MYFLCEDVAKASASGGAGRRIQKISRRTLLSALTTKGALVTNFKCSFLMANDW